MPTFDVLPTPMIVVGTVAVFHDEASADAAVNRSGVGFACVFGPIPCVILDEDEAATFTAAGPHDGLVGTLPYRRRRFPAPLTLMEA